MYTILKKFRGKTDSSGLLEKIPEGYVLRKFPDRDRSAWKINGASRRRTRGFRLGV